MKKNNYIELLHTSKKKKNAKGEERNTEDLQKTEKKKTTHR